VSVWCLLFEQCGTINCTLTSVPQFGVCPSSKLAQLTADWHQCHSLVPTLRAIWHNYLHTDISATVGACSSSNVAQLPAHWHQCHSLVIVLWAMWHNYLHTDISVTVCCLPYKQCGTINCRLTSVPHFNACPSSNVTQLTAHWHQCHSSVPALREIWHN